MVSNRLSGGLIAAMALGGLLAPAAHAVPTLLTQGSQVIVDGASTPVQSTAVPNGLVQSVSVTLTFMKCPSQFDLAGGGVVDLGLSFGASGLPAACPLQAGAPGVLGGGAEEISFSLTSPGAGGVTLDLIPAGTYSTPPSDGKVTVVLMDDSTATLNPVGLQGLMDETATPWSILADPNDPGSFYGRAAGGEWTLNVEDNREGNPLGLFSFVLNVTLQPDNGQVPEPGTLALLGLGMIGLGVLKRR